MSNATTACVPRSLGVAMRHDPAAGAIMLGRLKIYGMAQAVTGDCPVFFELSEEVFDQVSPFVGIAVEFG